MSVTEHAAITASTAAVGRSSTTLIRCVAFDAVGTLIFATPSVAEAYAQIGRRFGSRASDLDVAQRFLGAFRRADADTDMVTEHGRTHENREREVWRRVVSEVLPDVSDHDQCFAELFEHFARPTSWRCFEDVAATLSELTKRGYQIVIASNFDARLNVVCDGLPELRQVRDRVISSLVGYRKLHPGFFAALCQSVACSPQEVLMIGDDWENDVRSARAAGLTAWHLRREQGIPDSDDDSLRTLTELLERLP